MAIEEVVDWATTAGDNKAHHPTSREGERAIRVSRSMQELQAAIARWRDTLGGEPVPLTGTVNVGTVGALMEWPKGTPPTDFLECDGSSLDTTVYADLFAEIGYEYGGSGANFNLPDYRGEFLRGWDHGAANDPDAASRTDRGDGTTGDNVGTKQGDEFKSHQHNIRRDGNVGGGNGTIRGNIQSGGAPSTNPILAAGGNETRGRNVNVMICIRYQRTTETLTITGEGVGTGGGTGNPTQSIHFSRAFG